MQVHARVRSGAHQHEASVGSGELARGLAIAAKADGQGSSVNGGELLMLALATCYCNDLYREAARMGIVLTRVEVEASAEFPGVGLAARDIVYSARVESPADPREVQRLIAETDAVAEIHNTVRAGVPVTLA